MNDGAFEIDRTREWPSTFARHENESVRFFARRDERAEKIRRDSGTAPADARNSPCDRFG